MVLNTPHDNDCGDDLSWEMVIDVVEAEEELRLVDGNDDDAAAAGGRSSEVGTQTDGVTIIASSDGNYYYDDIGDIHPSRLQIDCHRASVDVASVGVTISDGDTFITGVSSITAEQYHHPSFISACISDVDDDDENGEGGSDHLLVEQLLSMGFEKAQIMGVISNLHSAGVSDIDADMIIGKMMGESPTSTATTPSRSDENCPLEPLLDAWEHVGSTAREWDDRGRLFVRQRVVGQVQAVGRHAREAWTNAFLSGERYEGDDLDYDVSDSRGGHCTDSQFRKPTTLAKSSFFRGVNEDNNRIIKGVVAVAIVGSATLLALGNPRASLGAMALTGAGIAAGEAIRMHHSSEQVCTSSTSRSGRGQHLD